MTIDRDGSEYRATCGYRIYWKTEGTEQVYEFRCLNYEIQYFLVRTRLWHLGNIRMKEFRDDHSPNEFQEIVEKRQSTIPSKKFPTIQTNIKFTKNISILELYNIAIYS